jgi:hypothetical protein
MAHPPRFRLTNALLMAALKSFTSFSENHLLFFGLSL